MPLLFLLASLSVFAQWNGSFIGEGRAVFASGRVYECSEIFLRLERSTDAFRFREGGYACGDLLQAAFDAFKFTLKGNKLFIKDQEVGTVTDEKFDYSLFDPEDGSTYHLELTRNSAGEIFYEENWHDGERIALTVKGLLRKK
jgi:hypothetical protein